MDDVVTANQDHRDADKQRNKKDWHDRLLSVVVLVAHQRAPADLVPSRNRVPQTSPDRNYQLPAEAEPANAGADA
jgi:hypothetical protein